MLFFCMLHFQGALENHYKMINEFKGVPGVLPEKLAEGIIKANSSIAYNFVLQKLLNNLQCVNFMNNI